MDLIITLRDWTGHPGVPCPVDCLKQKPCKYNCVPFSGDHHRAGKESRETHVLLFEGRDRESFDINIHHLELFSEGVNAVVVDGDWSPGLADAHLRLGGWRRLRVRGGGGHQLAVLELVLEQDVERGEGDERGKYTTDLLQDVRDVGVGGDEDRLTDLTGNVPSDGKQLQAGQAGEEGAGAGGDSGDAATHDSNQRMTGFTPRVRHNYTIICQQKQRKGQASYNATHPRCQNWQPNVIT